MKLPTALFMLAFANSTLAADQDSIPSNESDFITAVESIRQEQIAELLGDPAATYAVRNKDGEIVGAIWHYHYVTISDDGQYYKTTELDFIGDRVVTVVLINSDVADEGAAVANAPCGQGLASIC